MQTELALELFLVQPLCKFLVSSHKLLYHVLKCTLFQEVSHSLILSSHSILKKT
jgi:hypothetical protein